MCHVKRFMRDERGLETVEYGVIAGVVVLGTATAITLIGLWVQARIDIFERELHGGGGTTVIFTDQESR